MRARLSALALITGCVVGSSSGDEHDDGTAGTNLTSFDTGDTGESGAMYAHVCAPGATTLGIDVSYYEGSIDWTTVAGAGVKFAFIRVSDGTGFHDPRFATYWSGAHDAGVIRGAYQFFRPNQNPIAQADLLIQALGGHYTVGDLPPVIDVEVTGGLGASAVASKVGQWVAHVKAALGVDPIIYTGKYFWRDQVGGSTAFASDALWIAQYTSQCPDLPAPWTRWTFWQYSDSGSIPGISGHVDVDRFDGTVADLAGFAGGTVTSQPPPPPPTTCASSTLDRDVADGTCVQAASDAHWYACSAGMWVAKSSSAGCAQAYGWCDSSTLHTSVAPRTCVQSASDHVWYQCDGSGWANPVSNGAGPAGTCSSEHAL